ncbi:ATP-binding protein [Streptomyces sp. bgisy031]|uniref:ATP-binding protein n=1 Tax=Streptomyces sp. bgisy031 TaxID=3413772 RepID=UPI003D74F829
MRRPRGTPQDPAGPRSELPPPQAAGGLQVRGEPNVTPESVGTLADLAWVTHRQPLCLIGDNGTGKSHLLIGVGTAIAEAGLRVRYTTTVNLINELAEAADEKQGGRSRCRSPSAPRAGAELCWARWGMGWNACGALSGAQIAASRGSVGREVRGQATVRDRTGRSAASAADRRTGAGSYVQLS